MGIGRRIAAALARLPAVAITTLLSACAPIESLNALLVPDDGWRAEHGIAYGDGDRRKLDIYMPDPAVDKAPVVVFIYGGSWSGGKRGYYRFVGEALTSRGFVVVIPDYRVYPEVGFPVFVEDGAAAVAWVHAYIARWGGDPDRVTLMGHSAGAHIAALLATDRHYLADVGLPPGAVRGFIGLAGPYAIDPSRYKSIRPIFASAESLEATQPITFIDGDEPPMLLLHGAADETVFPVNTLAFGDRMRAFGRSAEVIEYEGVGHVRIVLDMAEPFRRPGGVLDDVDRFLQANTPNR